MRLLTPGLTLLTFSLAAMPALAHVSVVSAPAIADKTGIVELAIPHGCTVGDAHLDTTRIEVVIPASITSIRPVFGALGNVQISVETVEEGSVTKLSWNKPADTALEEDSQYYSVQFRAKMPNTPFAKVALPTTQYCQNGDEEVSVSWIDVSGAEHNHDAATPVSANPAPLLMIYPVRYPGWNQYTTVTDQHLHDMSIFNDAEVVWWNSAAYSSNPATQTMIEADDEVATLSEIHDNATFWVKY